MKPSELLSDESKWTKGAVARDKNGNSIDYDDKNAVSWCLVGAMMHCDHHVSIPKETISKLFPDRETRDYVSNFNNHPDTTYEDVILVLKECGL